MNLLLRTKLLIQDIRLILCPNYEVLAVLRQMDSLNREIKAVEAKIRRLVDSQEGRYWQREWEGLVMDYMALEWMVHPDNPEALIVIPRSNFGRPKFWS